MIVIFGRSRSGPRDPRPPWRWDPGLRGLAWHAGDFTLGLFLFVILPPAVILGAGWGLWFLITGHA